MSDLEYWKERTRQFGEASVGYGCNERLIHLDNVLRGEAIARLVTVGPGMRVLDVGTASGFWAIRFAAMGASVVGLDFNDDILAIAEERGPRGRGDRGMAQPSPRGGGTREGVVRPHYQRYLPAAHYRWPRARSGRCVSFSTRSRRMAGSCCSRTRFVTTGAWNEYMRSHTQRGWIDLVESQGGRLVDYTGVSFVRFRSHVPPRLCALADRMLSRIPSWRHRATVSAFSFRAGS